MRVRFFVSFLFLLVPLSQAHAGPHPKEIIVVSETRQTHFPTSPGALEEFALVETKEVMRLPEQTADYQVHLTDVRAVVKTSNVPELKDFLIVQYIRGCQFESTWDGKRETKQLNVSREHFGRISIFKHPTWEIDTDTTDPSRAALRGDRHALWRWNQDPSSLDPATSSFFSSSLPPHPVAFFADLPGSAYRLPDSGALATARNSSLEYKTCLYRTDEVPLSSDKKGTALGGFQAIHCFEWNHKFIYNFKKARFESPAAIDPICL